MTDRINGAPLPTTVAELLDLTTPDTAQVAAQAAVLAANGDHEEAIRLVVSRLAVMDLRYQDTEATLSVAMTHLKNYAEALENGLFDVPVQERQALARLWAFVMDTRPKSSIHDLLFRVRRLAQSDAAHYLSIHN